MFVWIPVGEGYRAVLRNRIISHKFAVIIDLYFAVCVECVDAGRASVGDSAFGTDI